MQTGIVGPNIQSIGGIGLSGGIGSGIQTPAGDSGGGGSYTYATFDPATLTGSFSISNGNLTISKEQDWIPSYGYSTISKSYGKWYFEISSITGYGQLGIQYSLGKYGLSPVALKLQDEYGVASYGYYWANAFATTPKVVGFMLDLDSNELSFTLNGANQGVAFTLPAGEYKVYIKDIAHGNYVANFGATPFTYPVPSGFNSGLYI